MNARERWGRAAPLVAMALCEAGYPTDHNPEDGLLYLNAETPDHVLTKACELAGVGDLLDALDIDIPCDCGDHQQEAI